MHTDSAEANNSGSLESPEPMMATVTRSSTKATLFFDSLKKIQQETIVIVQYWNGDYIRTVTFNWYRCYFWAYNVRHVGTLPQKQGDIPLSKQRWTQKRERLCNKGFHQRLKLLHCLLCAEVAFCPSSNK